MALLALAGWVLDETNDPTGATRRGLTILSQAVYYDQSVVDYWWGMGGDGWDCLQRWANYLG